MVTALLLGPTYEAVSQPQEQALTVQHTIPSDDSFIGQVRDVKISADEVFVADYQRNAVFVHTREGTLLRQIGEGTGEGPGEIRYIGRIDVVGDSVFVANNGNRRFDLFHREGQFIETYAPRYVYTSDFTLTNDGSIYGSAFKRSGSNRLISRIGRDGELIKLFPSNTTFRPPLSTMASYTQLSKSQSRFGFWPIR